MTLLLALMAALAQPEAAALLSAEGRVSDASPREEYDIPYAEHQLRLVQGTRYRITVTVPPRGGFPSRIQIRQGRVLDESFSPGILGEGEPIPEARLDFIAPRTGDYQLRVLALYSEPRGGTYSVRVVALPPLPEPRAAPASATQAGNWQIWTGSLDESDRRAIVWLHDDYPLEMRAGETWIATVERDGGPRYEPGDGPQFKLEILSPDNPDGMPIDSAEGFIGQNAAIAFQPARSGIYIVRVLGGNTDGAPAAYRLSVSRLVSEGRVR